MQPQLMIYKLSIPLGFGLGWLLIRSVRSRLDDRTLERAPFYAVGGLVLLFCLAAALRFGLELEFVFPEFIRTKATFFKWTAMEIALAIAFGAAGAAEAGKRARAAARLKTGEIAAEESAVAGSSWLGGLDRREALCFFIIMAVVFGAEAWMLRPVYYRCENIVNDNGITIQSLDSTCGPAALSTLFRTFGVEETEKELARIGGTRTNGMTGGELCAVASNRGFIPDFRVIAPEDLISAGRSCLLGVGDDHWVVFLGYNHKIGKFVLADPSFGVDLTDRDSLMKTWGGKALYLTPAGANAPKGANSVPDPTRLPGVVRLLGLE